MLGNNTIGSALLAAVALTIAGALGAGAGYAWRGEHEADGRRQALVEQRQQADRQLAAALEVQKIDYEQRLETVARNQKPRVQIRTRVQTIVKEVEREPTVYACMRSPAVISVVSQLRQLEAAGGLAPAAGDSGTETGPAADSVPVPVGPAPAVG